MERAITVETGGGRPRVAGTRRLPDETAGLVGLAAGPRPVRPAIGPPVFPPPHPELIARQTVIVCVAALGMTMVIVSGGIDLSVGSVVALSTVVTAVLLRQHGPALSAAGAIAAGAACGLVNGMLITQLRVVPFIVTL